MGDENNNKDQAAAVMTMPLVSTEAAVVVTPIKEEEPRHDSPPASAKLIHHMDARSRALGRKAELEELRSKHLAQSIRQDIAQAGDSSVPLSSAELTAFFLQQRRMDQEWRRQQRDSIDYLHNYKNTDAVDAATKASEKGQQPLPPSFSSRSEMDLFFQKQREMDLEWRRQQRDSVAFLHSYRDTTTTRLEHPEVLVTPDEHGGEELINMSFEDLQQALQDRLELAVTVPLPDSPILSPVEGSVCSELCLDGTEDAVETESKPLDSEDSLTDQRRENDSDDSLEKESSEEPVANGEVDTLPVQRSDADEQAVDVAAAQSEALTSLEDMNVKLDQDRRSVSGDDIDEESAPETSLSCTHNASVTTPTSPDESSDKDNAESHVHDGNGFDLDKTPETPTSDETPTCETCVERLVASVDNDSSKSDSAEVALETQPPCHGDVAVFPMDMPGDDGQDERVTHIHPDLAADAIVKNKESSSDRLEEVPDACDVSVRADSKSSSSPVELCSACGSVSIGTMDSSAADIFPEISTENATDVLDDLLVINGKELKCKKQAGYCELCGAGKHKEPPQTCEGESGLTTSTSKELAVEIPLEGSSHSPDGESSVATPKARNTAQSLSTENRLESPISEISSVPSTSDRPTVPSTPPRRQVASKTRESKIVRPRQRVTKTDDDRSNEGVPHYMLPISCTPKRKQKSPTRVHSPKKRVPIYSRHVADSLALKEECTMKWIPDLHQSKDGCERCLHFASTSEQQRFHRVGHHYRISTTRGGCARSCRCFPRKADELPVRLCRKCFYDTHKLGKM